MKLVRFLMKCTNESVQVELKNGSIVSGTVTSVSPVMNIALRAVKYRAKKVGGGHEDPVAIDTMTVRGNTVRQVILPENLPLDSLLIDDAPKPKNKAKKETERTVAPRGGRGGRGMGRGRGGGRGGRGRGGRGF